MKKRLSFRKRKYPSCVKSGGCYATIIASMTFKKRITHLDSERMYQHINQALADLCVDYHDDIIIDSWCYKNIWSRSDQKVYVFLRVSRDFAKKNLKYGDYWAPEKYLSRYLSRVARRIRKSNPFLASYFKDGVFNYHYIY